MIFRLDRFDNIARLRTKAKPVTNNLPIIHDAWTSIWVKLYYHYDPVAGLITCFEDRSKVGSLTSEGYTRINVKGKGILAHRMVWFLSTGSWPTLVIDHIDRNRSNNRISNLREVSVYENNLNKCLILQRSK